MSRLPKMHQPLGAGFDSVLKAVADGGKIAPASKFVITGLDWDTAERMKANAPEGIQVDVTERLTRGSDVGSVLLVILNVAGSLAANIAASWIYDKLKDYRAAKIAHRGKEVEVKEIVIRRRMEQDRDIRKHD